MTLIACVVVAVSNISFGVYLHRANQRDRRTHEDCPRCKTEWPCPEHQRLTERRKRGEPMTGVTCPVHAD